MMEEDKISRDSLNLINEAIINETFLDYKEKDNQFINTVSLDKIYLNSQQHFEQAKNSYEELADWNSVIH